MSSNEMTPLKGSDDALVKRYREASELLGETPRANVRSRVLAEAARVAAEKQTKAAIPVRATKRAANDSSWRYALAASVFIASVTGFIAFQLTSDLSENRVAEVAPQSSSPAAASAPAAAATQSTGTLSAPAPSSPAASPGSEVALSSAQPSTASTAQSRSTKSDASPQAVSKRGTPASADEAATTPRTERSIAIASQASVAAERAIAPERATLPAPAPAPVAAPTPAAPATAAAPTTAPAPQARGAMSANADSALFSAESAAAAPAPAMARNAQQKVGGAETARANATGPDKNRDARERLGDTASAAPKVLARAPSAQAQLRSAVQSGDVAQIERAIAMGADPNALDAEGELPLVRAARVGANDVVTALLQGGAQVNARNSRGESALEVAERSNQRAIVERLRQAGAR
ncbi:MAG: ankyrin repeat domain-containing protein [Betaproteobacteria bacterium]|nr:MAG: ankyrin repeat domain-containing protein [Betaproteobacteria bacterium]